MKFSVSIVPPFDPIVSEIKMLSSSFSFGEEGSSEQFWVQNKHAN